jgi:hypothetical protein
MYYREPKILAKYIVNCFVKSSHCYFSENKYQIFILVTDTFISVLTCNLYVMKFINYSYTIRWGLTNIFLKIYSILIFWIKIPVYLCNQSLPYPDSKQFLFFLFFFFVVFHGIFMSKMEYKWPKIKKEIVYTTWKDHYNLILELLWTI